MAKFRTIKNSFIAGEISPTAFGRTDLPQYAHACKTLRNMIPFLSGGAYRRPGTFFEVSYDGTTDYAPRLIPFVVSKTEAYCLVLGKVVGGNGYIDCYRPTTNNLVATAGTVSGTHAYKVATITNAIGNYDEIHDIQYVQSVDVLYLAHPNRKPLRFSRTAADTFALAEFDNGLTGATFRDAWPYRAQNTSAITLSISTASVGTGRTLTASAAFFNSAHVGAVFKVDHAGTIGCCRVTGFTSSTQVTAEVMVAFGATTAVATWWESSWSDYRGWPRSIAFYQQRLAYGGNATERDSVWFSQSSNFNAMSVSTITNPNSSPTGAQPFQLTLASQQLNLIQWLAAKDTLQLGTQGEEWIIEPEQAGGFGCDNARATLKTNYGSDHRQAVRLGNELIFALSSGHEVRSLVFNQLQNDFIAEPVQLLYDEYPQVEVSQSTNNRKYRTFSWDESRKTLWCCDTRGNLFGMTRDRSLQITMWHSHRMGGYDSTETGGVLGSGSNATIDPAYENCSGSVLSLAVVPNPVIGFNDLWLCVKREIDGAIEYHIERMIGGMVPNSSVTEFVSNASGNYYVDSAAYSANDYPLTETFTFSGNVDHLEGKELRGNAYGATGIFTLRASEVSSGNTEIQNFPSGYDSNPFAVALGLPFSSIVDPVRPEAGSVIGTSQGASKRIHEAWIRFYRTMAAKVGRDADNLETLIFRTGSQPINQSAELYTGDKRVKVDSDYDRDAFLYILQDEPLPFAVMALMAEGVTYD